MTKITEDSIVVGNFNECGALVMWRKRGEVELASLRKAWIEAGLDPDLLPHLPEPSAALPRALKGMETSRGSVRVKAEVLVAGKAWELVARRVESVEAKKEDAQLKEEGVELVQIPEGSKYANVMKVKLSPLGELIIEPKTWDKAAELERRYRIALRQLSTGDISDWLVRMVRHVGGIAALDQGGVYFVHRDHLPLWKTMCAALHSVSETRVRNPPASTIEDVVGLVLDGLNDEIEKEVNAIQRELEKGEIGTEAKVTSRKARLEDMAKRAEGYRSICGEALNDLTKKLRTMGATLTHLDLTKSLIDDEKKAVTNGAAAHA